MTVSKHYNLYFKSLLFLSLFIWATQIFGQNPCEKIVISACIDLNTELHIKKQKMWWKWGAVVPGSDPNCAGKTTVNDKEWKEAIIPFTLNFQTDFRSATISTLQTNEISKLIQLPSSNNGWETIWLFADPQSPGSSRYAISILFCPIKKSTENNNNVTSKDPIKQKSKSEPNVTTNITPTADIICKVNFETNKTIITKNSEEELSSICTSLHSNNLQVEISGYKSGNNHLKLFEERSIIINNFLVGKGVDQKRIKYIGYGDSDKKVPSQKVIKYSIIIN